MTNLFNVINFISGSGGSVLKRILNVSQSVWQMGYDDIIYIIFFILRIPSMLTVYIRPIEIIFTTLVSVVVRV